MTQPELPKIGAPAIHALEAVGVTRLAGFADHREAELPALHGFGSRALGILREALAEQGVVLRP